MNALLHHVLLPHVSNGRYGTQRNLLGASAPVSNTTDAYGADSHDASHDEAHLVFEYEELLRVLAFLACTWLLGWVARKFGFPELVGNVLTGVLLGPELADVCGQFTLAMMLVGEVGFLLMMLEGGLEVDVPMLMQLGHRGFGVAIVGQGVSICSAIGMMMIFGLEAKSAFAAGAVFAPMSTSVLLAVFKQFELLNTPTGQLCLVAAVFDDCYGLILLSELKAVKEGGLKNILVPLVTSLGWLGIVGFFAIRYFPKILNKYIMPHVPKKNRKGFLLGLCFSIAVALASALYYTYASRYLGVFLAGLFFCTSPALQHDIWTAQVKKIHRWLLRIFFAATVGFEIPIRSFWTARVWIKAAAFLVPFVGKGVVGIFAPAPLKEEFWKVGIAMMSRGEMSFVINRMARAELQLIDKETGAALMLTVVLAIFVVPLVLSLVLRYFAQRRERELNARAKERGPDSVGSSYYRLVIRTPHTFGLLDRVMRVLHLSHVEVLDFRMEYEDDFTILEAYLLETDNSFTSDELQHKRVTELRESIKILISHDRDSLEGTELIKKHLEEMALEDGGKETVLRSAVQDDVFERAGRGVMVTQWAPWIDLGFMMRQTYHPIPMVEVNETARPSDIYRRSHDPARRSQETARRSARPAVEPMAATAPKAMKAADVLRLARKSLAESRAFRTSYVPNGGGSRDSSHKSGAQYSTYMTQGSVADAALASGNGDTPRQAPRAPKFERVSMHLQHAHTYSNAHGTNGHEGGHEHGNGNGHGQPDDDEIMARLIAVGIVPAPASPVPEERPSNVGGGGAGGLARKSAALMNKLVRRSMNNVDTNLPNDSLDAPPSLRSGVNEEPEAGGHFVPQSPAAAMIMRQHENSMTGRTGGDGRGDRSNRTGVPPPPQTPRSRFGDEAGKDKE